MATGNGDIQSIPPPTEVGHETSADLRPRNTLNVPDVPAVPLYLTRMRAEGFIDTAIGIQPYDISMIGAVEGCKVAGSEDLPIWLRQHGLHNSAASPCSWPNDKSARSDRICR